jgi:hypothetical protein
MSEKIKENWEKEFDKQFTDSSPGNSGLGGNDPQEPVYELNCEPKDIKDFIRSLLEQEREEKEKELKIADDRWKKAESIIDEHTDEGGSRYDKGYQDACNNIIKTIKTL